MFTIKYKTNSIIERYKARLVTEEYTQTYEIDYQEIFVPVGKIKRLMVP